MARLIAKSTRSLCHRRITALCGSSGRPADFEDWVTRAVHDNLATGRFQRVAARRSKDAPLTLPAYVDLVIANASREYFRIRALEKGDSAEWDRLREFLSGRSRCMIRGFRRQTDINADALDCVQQACSAIYLNRYPLDVSFEAWATTILKRIVLRAFARSSDVLDQAYLLQSLDEPRSGEDASPAWNEAIAEPQGSSDLERAENQMLLLQAIDQLRSGAQRLVIIYTYLDAQSDEEIARRLGKSRQAVYNLRDRALTRLKSILTEPQRKKDGQNIITKSRRPRRERKGAPRPWGKRV